MENGLLTGNTPLPPHSFPMSVKKEKAREKTNFKRCRDCCGKIPSKDRHELCLFCLGDAHNTSSCSVCSTFNKQTLKNRAARHKVVLLKQALQPKRRETSESRPAGMQYKVSEAASTLTSEAVGATTAKRVAKPASASKVLASTSTEAFRKPESTLTTLKRKGSAPMPEPQAKKMKKHKRKDTGTGSEHTSSPAGLQTYRSPRRQAASLSPAPMPSQSPSMSMERVKKQAKNSSASRQTSSEPIEFSVDI
ncbi:uncharacterized protein LOC128343593 [Hemicordylus capensis]|uniref:uncharacterized protein LOC128343593 n=1 Tax=Hemicordylus capensis TaxID=884348 RepID=UPI0023033A68|nr:uncharacterized protein LOC128343593 [Hemicordylus capensis]